jgi:type III secretion system YscQ/HrcQ family protein
VTLCGSSGIARLVVEESFFKRPAPPSKPGRSEPFLRLAPLSFILPLQVARFPIAARELPLMHAGDVILSPRIPSAEGSAGCWLKIGEGGFPACVTDGTARISGPYRQGGFGMIPEETDRTALAEGLSVELVLELGRVQLTGAQVMDLVPGDVLTLDRPLAGAITIRASGKLIARGELVDVEGEAGVRLLEVYD